MSKMCVVVIRIQPKEPPIPNEPQLLGRDRVVVYGPFDTQEAVQECMEELELIVLGGGIQEAMVCDMREMPKMPQGH
jgi:hypothetical protein